MIQVNRLGDNISGSLNGEPFSVSYDAAKYETMLDLQAKSDKADTMEELTAIIEEFKPLTQESYGDMIATISPYIMVDRATNKFHLQFNGEVSTKALPKVLADKMIKLVEKNIEITPLIKFWARWLRNPYYTDAKSKLLAEYIEAPYVNDQKVAELTSKQGLSHEVAVKAATTTQVAITREGLMAGYKVSKEMKDRFTIDEQTEEVKKLSRFGKDIDPDTGLVTYKKAQYEEERVYEPALMGQTGDAFNCTDILTGIKKLGHTIKVGCSISLDSWDQVNTDDRQSGVKGLHVGGLRYIQGYQNDGTETHNVFIDPMHIGAIVGLGTGNDGALRVKQYFVESTFNGVNKQIYRSSRYAELTDMEYAEMVKEAVALTSKKAEKIQKEARERSALATI